MERTLISLFVFLVFLSPLVHANWAWIAGQNTSNTRPTYGVRGTTSPSNQIGGRSTGHIWKDSLGNIWMFGGFGWDCCESSPETLNDLWRWDGTYWTWVSGPNNNGNRGTYGQRGTGNANTIPGSREKGVSWIDSQNNLWLFGGNGYDSVQIYVGSLNDLWKYNTGTGIWTWMSGATTHDQTASYGQRGVASATNRPGARAGSQGWTSRTNNDLYLFGGYGFDSSNQRYQNDLWRFDGTNWAWIAGSNQGNNLGRYGTYRQASPSNAPGARGGTFGATDNSNNLWLFGGESFDDETTSTYGVMNDLWRFDGTNWAWMHGCTKRYGPAVYGVRGVAAAANTPGARQKGAAWFQGNSFWIFGGEGYDANGLAGKMNDIWRFDLSTLQWTWVTGCHLRDKVGSYGTLGVYSPNNNPSSRYEPHGTVVDAQGRLILFGGNAYGFTSPNLMTDIWAFDPSRLVTGSITTTGPVSTTQGSFTSSTTLSSTTTTQGQTTLSTTTQGQTTQSTTQGQTTLSTQGQTTQSTTQGQTTLSTQGQTTQSTTQGQTTISTQGQTTISTQGQTTQGQTTLSTQGQTTQGQTTISTQGQSTTQGQQTTLSTSSGSATQGQPCPVQPVDCLTLCKDAPVLLCSCKPDGSPDIQCEGGSGAAAISVSLMVIFLFTLFLSM